MHKSRRFLVLGILSLVLTGIFSSEPIGGLFLALTILGFVGSFSAITGGDNES